MKALGRIVLLPILCFLTSCASQDYYNIQSSRYPFLKSEATWDRMRWRRADGPDFWVFDGHLTHDKSSGAGFYLGFYPDFPPKEQARIVKGQLGIFSFDWYETRSETPPRISREALIRPAKAQSGRRKIPIVDVWITGNSETEIERTADELGKIALFTKGPDEFFIENTAWMEDKSPIPFEWQQSRRSF